MEAATVSKFMVLISTTTGTLVTIRIQKIVHDIFLM